MQLFKLRPENIVEHNHLTPWLLSVASLYCILTIFFSSQISLVP